jgi:hypothetical protein
MLSYETAVKLDELATKLLNMPITDVLPSLAEEDLTDEELKSVIFDYLVQDDKYYYGYLKYWFRHHPWEWLFGYMLPVVWYWILRKLGKKPPPSKDEFFAC